MVPFGRTRVIMAMALAFASVLAPSAIVAQEASCAPTTPEENQGIVEAYIAAVEARDGAKIDALLADDFSHNMSALGAEVMNEPGNADEIAALDNVPGPVAHEIEDIFAGGDRVAVRFSFEVPPEAVAGSTATEPVTAEAIVIVRIECGGIRELWAGSNALRVLLAHGYQVTPAS